MDDLHESDQNEKHWTDFHDGTNRWLVIAVIALFGIVAVTFAYGYHQQSLARQLSTQQTASSATVNQLQSQVSDLTAKLSQMSVAQTAPQAAPTPAAAPSETSTAPVDLDPQASASEPAAKPKTPVKHTHAKRRVVHHRPAVDKKYQQLQAQLDDQEKQLKATQDQMTKDRSDLESSISSTRDDLNSTRDNLNGSIARTHDELVSLEKKGERNYVEFDLTKSKQFQRVGPLTLSLRKADTKHKHFNLAMMVDDNELQKKNVNLYEPIWIHSDSDADAQSVQVVVNKIDKNHVHGYISSPKYKPSELATTGTANVTPVSAKTPVPTTPPSNGVPNPQHP
ncbi:MAG TPA: hypothetical protein VJN93_16650 [Candidatus Acidoferrum sp.]|nr:hypothetical protein [Candidatus Acidoferrum sp.]